MGVSEESIKSAKVLYRGPGMGLVEIDGHDIDADFTRMGGCKLDGKEVADPAKVTRLKEQARLIMELYPK